MRLQSQKKENKVHHQKRIMCTYALSARNLLLLQLLPDMSYHRRVCGKQFRVQDGVLRPTAHFSHTCPTCGTCVQSTKEFGANQKANTNNPMVARAAERNGMQSNNKEARSMKTCNKKTGSQIITCRRTTTCPGNHFPWRKHQGSEWLLAASCYWRWLLATSYVHLLRALA